MSDDTATQKAPRGPRSPGYPAVSLEEAIDRARVMKEKWPNRKPVPIDTALRFWGYTPKSGAGFQLVASLKKFGLLEDEGSKDQRVVMLTDRAWRILSDRRPESRERAAELRQAALSPKIHQDIREHWPHGLPDDSKIEYWLVTQKGFNEKSVAGFLSVLRSTFEYAELDEMPDSGDSDKDTGEGGSGPSKEVPELAENPSPSRSPVLPEPPPDAFPLPVLMDDGSFQVVDIPTNMTSNSFSFFLKQLEVYKSAIVKDAPKRASDEADDMADEDD